MPIAEKFKVSRPAISQHIKILTECGLIVIHQQGRERFCEARLQSLNEVSDWIEPFRKRWTERFDKLDDLLKQMKNKSPMNKPKAGSEKINKSQKNK
ncbi:MAG: ArsR family transcriptional regulator [Saprospiraceae bacterium]|nr:ArsR family transcriptional regulator [Saprospiraceae bacterium]